MVKASKTSKNYSTKLYAILGVVIAVLAPISFLYFNGSLPVIPWPWPNPNPNPNPNPSGVLPLSWTRYSGNPFSLPGGSVLHPDVLYFDSPMDGYNYWMVYTPYPPDAVENPSVVRSTTGYSWSDSGISNPVIPGGTAGLQYNADVDWLYVSEYHKFFMTWCLWSPHELYIAFAYSTDGKVWTCGNWGVSPHPNSPILFSDMRTEPTMYYQDGVFHLFAIGGSVSPYGSDGFIAYYTFQWDNGQNRPVNMASHGEWRPPAVSGVCQEGTGHIDVVKYGSNFYLYGLRLPASGETSARLLYCFKATSPGLSWENYGVLLQRSGGWESGWIYRSSILHDGVGNAVVVNGKLWLYYTGGSSVSEERIGLAQATPIT